MSQPNVFVCQGIFFITDSITGFICSSLSKNVLIDANHPFPLCTCQAGLKIILRKGAARL